ncbi:jg13419 [Pararge aegeria aegeria]|uniref:Jg13419 protein n=1 Tax=Pararge aegeria aegeria TaxID=348720 RepID=A0A8S4RYS0_9NEOP|nr:jg13419 [Pararge aegeria aegeria]
MENSTFFLGVTLDCKLQWGAHIETLAGKLSSAAYAVRKMRQLTDAETVKPQASCVPTQIVKGPCHECMCDVDGVFVCHATTCPKSAVNPRKSYKGECQPHVTYKFEELYCTCNFEGRWLSFNCRETFQYLRSYNKAKHILRSTSTIPCTPNSLFLIDCNVCQCDNSGRIRQTSCTNRICTTKPHKADVCKFGDFLRTKDEICICSDINFFIDRLCVKVGEKSLQELQRNDIALLTNTSHIRKNMDHTCVPLMEYKIDCNICVCDKNSELVCTNKICGSKKSALRIDDGSLDFYNLPSAQYEGQECVPNEKYRIKCNACVCSKKGTLTCTTMVCLEDFIFDERALADTLN